MLPSGSPADGAGARCGRRAAGTGARGPHGARGQHTTVGATPPTRGHGGGTRAASGLGAAPETRTGAAVVKRGSAAGTEARQRRQTGHSQRLVTFIRARFPSRHAARRRARAVRRSRRSHGRRARATVPPRRVATTRHGGRRRGATRVWVHRRRSTNGRRAERAVVAAAPNEPPPPRVGNGVSRLALRGQASPYPRPPRARTLRATSCKRHALVKQSKVQLHPPRGARHDAPHGQVRVLPPRLKQISGHSRRPTWPPFRRAP